MNSKQFETLANGTKIQITSRSGDDVAQGVIVSATEYSRYGSLVKYNRVKITDAPADSGWAKYLNRKAQHGFSIEHMTAI